jgi:hypothetical protein
VNLGDAERYDPAQKQSDAWAAGLRKTLEQLHNFVRDPARQGFVVGTDKSVFFQPCRARAPL